MVGFSCGFGSIPFLLMGEIFPAAQRSLLSSIAGSFNLSAMFFVIKTYHPLEAVSNSNFSLSESSLSFFSSDYNHCWYILDVLRLVCIGNVLCHILRTRDERTRYGGNCTNVPE